MEDFNYRQPPAEGYFVLDWCCTCKRSGESEDNLLLHSPIACAVDDGCCLFGLK